MTESLKVKKTALVGKVDEQMWWTEPFLVHMFRGGAALGDTRLGYTSPGGGGTEQMEERLVIFLLINSNHSVPKDISPKCFVARNSVIH